MPRIQLFSDKQYNIARLLVELVLPACGTLYFTLSGIWGLPNGEKVVGTIAAVTVFLGLCLKVSRAGWKDDDNNFDGLIEVDPAEDSDKDVYSLVLNQDPAILLKNDLITFKTRRH